MPAEVIVLLVFAPLALMALYAALRPEQYARYFLAKWQREMLSGEFKVLSWTGWGIFAGCIAIGLFVVLRTRVQPYGAVLEMAMLLVFAIAWLWWGLSLLLRPDAFIRRTNGRIPRWVLKVFGAVLLVGAANFGYQFAVKIRALIP